jgi:lysyl-tRNA synthetase class 2
MPSNPETGDQEQARLDKVRSLRASGDEPYKLSFDRDHEIAEIIEKHASSEPGASAGETVRIAGRLASPIREHGKAAFADLRDSGGQIQLFARSDHLGDRFESFCDLDMGDWIGVSGEVVRTKKGELSVDLESFEVLSKSIRPWPEKWHGLKDVELRYRRRYLDLATNDEVRKIFRVRWEVIGEMRRWLDDRGFVEVETPMLQPTPGGALARPFVTHHQALGVDLYLRIAPELYLKRLLVGGLEKVYEINRNFRNEGVSVKYNPEFTMLEAYEAYTDYEGMADLIESLLRDVATATTGGTKLPWQGHEIDLGEPFRRARLIDLVAETGADVAGDLAAECDRLDVAYDPKWPWGRLLVEIFDKKVEPHLVQPTFVMDYPVEVSPLARRHRSDERFTEQLDLIIGGIEMGPAYSELNDPLEQRARFEAQAEARLGGDEEAHVIDEDFLLALEHGMPPAGGLGLGIDRLVMLLTDSPSIREVILFPALRPSSG